MNNNIYLQSKSLLRTTHLLRKYTSTTTTTTTTKIPTSRTPKSKLTSKKSSKLWQKQTTWNQSKEAGICTLVALDDQGGEFHFTKCRICATPVLLDIPKKKNNFSCLFFVFDIFLYLFHWPNDPPYKYTIYTYSYTYNYMRYKRLLIYPFTHLYRPVCSCLFYLFHFYFGFVCFFFFRSVGSSRRKELFENLIIPHVELH